MAHGDAHSSNVVGKKIEDIELPKGATIGAIVRGLPITNGVFDEVLDEQDNIPSAKAQVIIAHRDVVIESEDHVILFVINRKMIREVERLFQVKVGFL